ncbi:MAG: ABC transporter permease subunit, partial [Eubacterium sp.]|nr:ABC transporter permease subunit [Eubacterium sp.]
LSAVLVAIVGFSLIFAVRVYTTVWSAIAAVDIGQQEAAYALGYPDGLAFRRVILPQARSVYIPMLQTQFVLLVKETSVAGYITVVDLTRAGDLIRSRTMEAFFPLIAIAIIYFLLTWLLTRFIKMVNQRLNEKSRRRRIKGVE